MTPSLRHVVDDSFLIGREREFWGATSARPVAPSMRRGRGRANKPQRAGPSKVSARGLSFGVPSSGSPGAASFSAAAAADASAIAYGTDLAPVLELPFRFGVGLALVDGREDGGLTIGGRLVLDGARDLPFRP